MFITGIPRNPSIHKRDNIPVVRLGRQRSSSLSQSLTNTNPKTSPQPFVTIIQSHNHPPNPSITPGNVCFAMAACCCPCFIRPHHCLPLLHGPINPFLAAIEVRLFIILGRNVILIKSVCYSIPWESAGLSGGNHKIDHLLNLSIA